MCIIFRCVPWVSAADLALGTHTHKHKYTHACARCLTILGYSVVALRVHAALHRRQFHVGWLHAVCAQTMGETAINHIVMPVTMQFASSFRWTARECDSREWPWIAWNNNSNAFAVHTKSGKLQTWRTGGFINYTERKININLQLGNCFMWFSPPQGWAF